MGTEENRRPGVWSHTPGVCRQCVITTWCGQNRWGAQSFGGCMWGHGGEQLGIRFPELPWPSASRCWPKKKEVKWPCRNGPKNVPGKVRQPKWGNSHVAIGRQWAGEVSSRWMPLSHERAKYRGIQRSLWRCWWAGAQTKVHGWCGPFPWNCGRHSPRVVVGSKEGRHGVHTVSGVC